jgi:predicted DNA-binding protein with PD1-like motif
MNFKKDNRRYIIRLDKGEELIETLAKFCDDNKLGFASFHGIGGLKECTLAYFDLKTGEYLKKEVNDEGIFELLSIQGNVSIKEGRTFVHAHVVLGKKDYSTIGGHLVEGTVNPTCEILLIALSDDTSDKDSKNKPKPEPLKISRKKDKDTGLMLLDI